LEQYHRLLTFRRAIDVTVTDTIGEQSNWKR
jgi:hypothetical protein